MGLLSGIGGFIGGAVKGAIGGLAGGLPGIVGGALLGGLTSKKAKPKLPSVPTSLPGVGITTLPPIWNPAASAAGVGIKLAAKATGVTINPATGEVVPRRRRMNVTNMKALDRSIRRLTGFEKRARKVMTFTTGKSVHKGKIKRRRAG